MIVNLHVYPSPFKFESRIIRESNTLLENKLVDKIIIASGWANGLKKLEYIDSGIEIRRFKTLSDRFLKSHKIFLASKYIELYLYISFFYLFKKVDIVNVHSLMVLPIGVFLKKFKRKAKLFYDAHELETERFGLEGFAQKLSKKLEWLFIGSCDRIIVVGNYIRKWYIKEYNLNENYIYTVRNLNSDPGRETGTRSQYLKEFFNFESEDIIFIYQGLLSKGRGIDVYLETFKKLPKSYKLVLMGYGPLEGLIRNVSEASLNIVFHPAVRPTEIVSVTSSAHIGLSLIENYCLSYYYSLPNKLFEYANSGLTIIGSNFPEMEDVIIKNEIGWVIEPNANELFKLITDESFYEEMNSLSKNINNFNSRYNWTKEQECLINVYKSL